MTRLQIAIDRIRFSRDYSLRLIESIPIADWFRMPSPAVTHVGWQVGHLAMAEYRMALERIRGALPDDAGLISQAFLKQFGKESVPDPEASKYPSPSDIRGVLDRVHAQTMRELAELPEAEWDVPPVKAHSLCKTKLEGVFWCAHHEMLHTGQIGLLRRLFGYAPQW
jgi:DinB superfamily